MVFLDVLRASSACMSTTHQRIVRPNHCPAQRLRLRTPPFPDATFRITPMVSTACHVYRTPVALFSRRVGQVVFPRVSNHQLPRTVDCVGQVT